MAHKAPETADRLVFQLRVLSEAGAESGEVGGARLVKGGGLDVFGKLCRLGPPLPFGDLLQQAGKAELIEGVAGFLFHEFAEAGEGGGGVGGELRLIEVFGAFPIHHPVRRESGQGFVIRNRECGNRIAAAGEGEVMDAGEDVFRLTGIRMGGQMGFGIFEQAPDGHGLRHHEHRGERVDQGGNGGGDGEVDFHRFLSYMTQGDGIP